MTQVDQDDLIKPVYNKQDYHEFHTAQTIKRDILSDLTEFNKYSNFSYEDLLSWRVREDITTDMNKTTPAVIPQPPPPAIDDEFTSIGLKQQQSYSVVHNFKEVESTAKKDKTTEMLAEDFSRQLGDMDDCFSLIKAYDPSSLKPCIGEKPVPSRTQHSMTQSFVSSVISTTNHQQPVYQTQRGLFNVLSTS